MTKKEYRVDAYARVPYAAFIHANSREEALEIAEKKAEEQAKKFSETFNQHHGYLDCSHYPHYGWGMTCDEVILQIDLTYQVNTCMRPFIRNFDD